MALYRRAMKLRVSGGYRLRERARSRATSPSGVEARGRSLKRYSAR